jgi:hypothetical protein
MLRGKDADMKAGGGWVLYKWVTHFREDSIRRQTPKFGGIPGNRL